MGQRARSVEDKQARRAAIVQAARLCFQEADYDALTMAEIAGRAGVAKGTLFLYFPSKEALFLEVLDELLHQWLAQLHDAVAQDERPWPSARLAGILTETLEQRPLLARLLPVGSHVLEQHVAQDRAALFRHRLMRRFFGTGSLIEQRLGLNRPGDGVQLLQFSYALIVGMRGRTEELRTALTVLFNGFHRRAQSSKVA